MPGIYGWRTNGRLNLEVHRYLVEASQTIYAGDIVVLAQEASNYNQPRARKLHADDITADYTETTIRGILGFAMHDIKTNSSGEVETITSSNVAWGAGVTYALPGYAAGIAAASGVSEGSEAEDKGSAYLSVAVFNNDTEVLMQAAGASDTVATVDVTYIGTTAGIQITDTVNFKLDLGDTSGDDSCFIITDVKETEPTYATSSKVTKVWCRVKSTLQQYGTGLVYATERA